MNKNMKINYQDPCCPNNIIEQAYKIHGIRRCVYSDEDSSDSDGIFPLDDDYEKLKPPPIEIPPEKIVLIEPSPPRERRKKKSKAKKGNKLPQKQSNTEKSKSISKNININNYYYILESDNSDDNSQKFDYQCESSCESMVVEQKNLDLENPTLSNKLEDTNHEDFILIKRNGKKLLPLNQTKEVLHQTLNIDKNKKISHNCTADLKDKTSNKTKNYDSENVCNYSNKNNKFKSANKSKKLVQEIQKPLVKANHVLPKQHKRNRLLSQKDENTNGQQSPKVNSRAVQKTAKVNPSKINLDRGLFYQTNEEHTYSEIIRKNIDKPTNMFYSEVTKLNTKTDVFSKKIQSAEKFISKVDKKKEMFYSEVTKLNTKTDLFSKKFQSAEKFISKVDKKKEIKKQINNNNQMLPHRKIKKDKPLTAQSAKKTLNTNFSLLSSIISPHESEVDEMMSVNRVTCNFGDLLPPRINKTIKKKQKGVRHELPAKSAKRLTKINPILVIPGVCLSSQNPQCGDNVSLQLKYKESNPLINKQDYVLVPEKRKKIRALKTVANLFSHHLETTGVPQLPQTYESFLLKPIEGESSKPIDEYDILLPPTYEQTLNEQPFKAAKKIAEVDLFTVHSKAQFDPIPLGDEQLMEYKIEKPNNQFNYMSQINEEYRNKLSENVNKLIPVSVTSNSYLSLRNSYTKDNYWEESNKQVKEIFDFDEVGKFKYKIDSIVSATTKKDDQHLVDEQINPLSSQNEWRKESITNFDSKNITEEEEGKGPSTSTELTESCKGLTIADPSESSFTVQNSFNDFDYRHTLGECLLFGLFIFCVCVLLRRKN